MPGFDGTGPRGKGPMSGWGRGYCLLHVPEEPGEDATGFAGWQGNPWEKNRRPTEYDVLRSRLRELQAALAEMNAHLSGLEAVDGT